MGDGIPGGGQHLLWLCEVKVNVNDSCSLSSNAPLTLPIVHKSAVIKILYFLFQTENLLVYYQILVLYFQTFCSQLRIGDSPILSKFLINIPYAYTVQLFGRHAWMMRGQMYCLCVGQVVSASSATPPHGRDLRLSLQILVTWVANVWQVTLGIADSWACS